MYRWYRNAQKCYVFLSDVFISSEADLSRRSTWEVSFRESQWFTRGWTLQELIAPPCVEFFSYSGLYLGDRITFKQMIHEITLIPIQALQNFQLETYSVEERRSWADKRVTQEAEDRAYCLLGLLGVQMSPSYGEGIDSAFRRLKAALVTSSVTTFVVPFPRNPCFVGRECELAELENVIFRDESYTRLAILGERGIGKSEVALEFAYNYHEKHSDCAIFWIDASSIDGLHNSCSTICQRLNVPEYNDEKSDLLQILGHYLSQPQAGRWLMIYDNADSVILRSTGIIMSASRELTCFLPESDTGCIIFTSTNSDIAKPLGITHLVELPAMTASSAQKLFEKYANRTVMPTESDDMKLLLEQLSYQPLALVQAAALVKIHGLTIHDYHTALSREETRCTLTAVLSGTQSCERVINESVLGTLLLSLACIRRDRPAAITVLCLAAYVGHADIPIELYRSMTSMEIRSSIELLENYRLVTRRPLESSIDIHRLAHTALRRFLCSEDDLGRWHQDAVTRVTSIFPDGEDMERSQWRRLMPHASSALSLRITKGRESAQEIGLMWKYGLALHREGHYNESVHLFTRVKDRLTTKLGADDLDTLTATATLAVSYWEQGRWRDAEELSVYVMESRTKQLGTNHPLTLSSMLDLAAVYCSQGRWSQAENLELQVMKIREVELGLDHPDTLNCMNSLASTYRNQDRLHKAKDLATEVTKRAQMKFGTEHSFTLTSMNNLATIYMGQGDHLIAEELSVQVLKVRTLRLGMSHPSTIRSSNNLASIYRLQGRWKEAKELYIKVIEAFQTRLGMDHPETLTATANLAATYKHQGQYQLAEELVARVMEARIVKLGADHPDTLTSEYNLALIKKDLGQDEQALSLMRMCTQHRYHILGATHPNYLSALATLQKWDADWVD